MNPIDRQCLNKQPFDGKAECEQSISAQRFTVPLYSYECNHCGKWHKTKIVRMEELMKLIDLEPKFIKMEDAEAKSFRTDAEIGNCDGLMFLCPVCFAENGGAVGTHSVICWKPHVSRDLSPGPGRWEIRGSEFGNLTLYAQSSSVKLNGGCNAHFFVTMGEIRLA